MGFRGIYSAILVTGLAQMTPATAQSRAPLHEAESMPTASAAAPAPEVTPPDAAPAPATKLADERQPVSEREAPEEVSATQEVKAKAIDPADKDLAAAPPEELKPAKIDPDNVRRAVASAAAAPAIRSAPQAVAAAAPAPQSLGEEQEGYAERVAAAERALQPELGGDAAFARSQRVAASQWRPAPAPRPVQAAAERAPLPARDEQEGNPAPAQDERVAIAPPRTIPSDRDDGDAQPAYADRYRNAPPAYAVEDREAPRDYGNRDQEDGARYAIQDRIGPDGPIRSVPEDVQWGDRQRAPIADQGGNVACDGARTDRLQQRIRQEAARGLIDPRAAQDLNDETGHAEELRRSYCASGMNDWREERLDRQYAQIEDRIRYEEDQSGRR
jgi:hypothetical protein